MNMHSKFALFSAALISAALMGCVTLTGNAKLGADGRTAILDGGAPLEIRAKQPALPPEPVKAKIVEEHIEITEKVQFAYNEATILSASNDLLNDVSLVMKQHPEVKKIRIEGHASSEGNDKYNKDLSDRRAKSVMTFLVDSGVAPERMEAIGYGEERPIADNDTEEGREKNRRVEFNIIARMTPEELAALKNGGSLSSDSSTESTPATGDGSESPVEE